LILILAIATSTAWAQISKDQLYEMTTKGLDETVIVSLVEKNCVDFEMDGQVIVELSTRVSPEVLRTVVDCLNAKKEEVAIAATAVAPTETMTAANKSQANVSSEKAFLAPSFVTIQLSSNKSSYTASEIELRLVQVASNGKEGKELRYRFTGAGELEKELRCYKSKQESHVEPGEYVAYLHIISNRSKGMRSKQVVRSDLHKFRAEFQGAGPITLDYTSTEEKSFRAKKGNSLIVHGPLQFFSEELVTVDGQKSLEDLLTTFGS